MNAFFLKQLSYAISGTISLLFAGNIFFVKRLVDRMDVMEQMLWGLRQEIAVLHATMESHHGDYHLQKRDSD